MPKPKPETVNPDAHVLEQGLAAWIAQLNEERRLPLYQALEALQNRLKGQDLALVKALGELDWVREKIGAPERILGSIKTKHGEIAEIAEVGVHRARELLSGQFPSAFWSGIGMDRFAPEDYGIGGTAVQSKFYNGVANTLRGVIEHAERYPMFGTLDGAYYHIPKDQAELVQRVLSGDTQGMSHKSIEAIRHHVQRLEELRGRSFDELVRPASHTYVEVQQGRIHQTLDGHESALRDTNELAKKEIVDEHRDDVQAAADAVAPTLTEMGKVTATGAAVGASIQLTVGVYRKWKQEGKRPTQFTGEDWKELGGDALSGAAAGGISAAALYGLTNYSALSAPFAGAVVSSGRAMATLAQQYRAGDISFDEFYDLSLIATAEAGIAAAGAALGQVVIPIPVLGATIGSAVAHLAAAHAKTLLDEQSKAFAEKLARDFDEHVAQLDTAHRLRLAQLEAEMLRLHNLMELAFDVSLNAELLLVVSVDLAESMGVPHEKILRDTEDVDLFMLGPHEQVSPVR